MKRISPILFVLAVSAGSPSLAKVQNGGNDALFLSCSEQHRKAGALDADLKQSEIQAKPTMAKLRTLRSALKREEAEASRLQKIADIMRNSDSVQAKYRRAVRRYNAALKSYKRHRAHVDRMHDAYERRKRARNSIMRRANAKCGGTWNSAILDRYCRSGDRKHRTFCSTFKSFSQAQKPRKKKTVAAANAAPRKRTPRVRDQVYCRGSDPDRRIRSCGRLIASGALRANKLADAHFNRGNAFAQKGHFDLAIADYDRTLALNPKHKQVRLNRNAALLQKRRRTQPAQPKTAARHTAAKPRAAARAPVSDCDRQAAHQDDSNRVAAAVSFKQINGNRAVRACKAAIKAHPNEGRFHAYLSRAYGAIGDHELSMYHARRSAEAGYPFGFHYVYIHYANAMGVKKDLAKQFKWSKAAAERRLPVGMHNLAYAYRKGEGTRKNLRKAERWFRMAILGGYDKAHWQLGLVYEEGIAGKPDLKRAEYHYEIAVRKGIKQARKALARVRAKQS